MTSAPRHFRRARATLLVPLLLLAGVGTAMACSVPVFRYALERWPADPYLALVFHEGPLTPQQEAWARDLDRGGLAGKMSANLAMRTVDVAATNDEVVLRLWRRQPAGTPLPAVVLLYPAGHGLGVAAWRGPLTEDNVRQVLDSPLRREIAARLLAGECTVWVLVESGETARDTAAMQVLESRLKHLTATLKLPEMDPADIVGGATTAPQEKLKVRFSAVRVSRGNPAEAALVGMLLNTEEDLPGAREPIAFPIFGRGRALDALVGRGINPEMIDEACGFVTGACSCIVKEQNPGRDLLMAVDWTNLVEPLISSDEDPPPLAGIADFAPKAAAMGGRAPSAKPAPVAAALPAKPGVATAADGAAAPAEGGPAGSPLVRAMILVGALLGTVVLGVTWWLLRHRG